MTIYKYTSINNDGKKMSGSGYFENEAELLISIRKKGYYVKKVKVICNINYNNLLVRTNIKDIAIFSKQLSSMLYVGFNISEALEIISNQITNKALRGSIKNIESAVQKGSSFYESINKYQNIFPTFFIEMINIGEQTGNLDNVLKSLSDYYFKEYKIKTKLKSAMIYPIILLVTTVSILLYLEINIIPLFSDTFSSLGTQLPIYSKCFMDMSNGIRDNLYLMVIVIVILNFLILAVFKADKFKYKRDKAYIIAPIIGKFNKKVIGAKFSNCIGLLQRSGVNIIYALDLGSKAINNSYVERKINNVLNNIRNGDNISETLELIGIFPSFMISMIALGEQAGNLEEMLSMAADIYSEDIEDTLGKMVSILEPVMIVILAFLVGIIIMSVLVPMLKTMQAV